MNGPPTPVFPITVRWAKDQATVCENVLDLCRDVEWFDSDDPSYEATVTDALGRAVRLKLEDLSVRLRQLA